MFCCALSSVHTQRRLLIKRAPRDDPSSWVAQCAQLDSIGFPPKGMWTAAQHEAELRSKHSEVLGAWYNADLVAFSYTAHILDETHMLSVVVHPDFRGRSLARTLLLVSMHSAFKSGQLLCTLEVRKSNEAAIGLYRSCGFRCVGTRPKYYSQPREDALIMTCFRVEHEGEVQASVDRSPYANEIVELSEEKCFDKEMKMDVMF